MAFVIGLLTLVMVLDCVVLIFLVLIQLPKKEAGAGLAFGGSATDALFGAGSGTVLTKITKYAAVVFFALAVFLSILQQNYHNRTTTVFGAKLGQPGRQPTTTPTQPAPAMPPSISAPPSNVPPFVTPPEATNLPPAATNLISVPSNAPPPTK